MHIDEHAQTHLCDLCAAKSRCVDCTNCMGGLLLGSMSRSSYANMACKVGLGADTTEGRGAITMSPTPLLQLGF